jgi:hypothetical protein
MGYGQGKRSHRKTSIRFDDGNIVDFTLCGRVLNGRDFKIAGVGEEVTCSKCRRMIDRLVAPDAPGTNDERRSEMPPMAKRLVPDHHGDMHIPQRPGLVGMARRLGLAVIEPVDLDRLEVGFGKEEEGDA